MNIGSKVRVKQFEEGKGSYLKAVKKITGNVTYIDKIKFTVQGENYPESFKFIDEVCGDIRIETLS
jgi:hypothetical protein